MLGLDAKYAKMKEYVKKVIVDKTDKQSNHSNFLAALKTWIDERNQNPDMTRPKDKDAVMKAHTILTPSKTMGSRLKAPKRLFILKEDWNEQKYGPLSEQKISERDVFGAKRKGIYRLAPQQALGHYEAEDFDDSGAWWGRASCWARVGEQARSPPECVSSCFGWTGSRSFQSRSLGYGVRSRCFRNMVLQLSLQPPRRVSRVKPQCQV